MFALLKSFKLRRKECDEDLRRERDEAVAQLEKIKDPELKHLRFADGSFNMDLAGPLVEHIAAVLTEYFVTSGAENYIEMTFHEKKKPFGTYALTVQKVEKKTPHQFRMDAENQLAQLQSKYETLVKFYDNQNGTPCEQIRHRDMLADIRNTLLPFWGRIQEAADWRALDELYKKYTFPKIEDEEETE